MRTTKSPVVGVLLGLSFVAACRSNNNNNNNMNPDGSTGPGSDTGTAMIHIQDVQSDAMVPGTAVELHGVIVTAIDTFGAKVGADMWVEEPGGGERSGVHVFRPPVSQLANLAVGDIVDITGATKTEFHVSSDTTGRTVTELQAPSGGMIAVTKTGTGTVPDPYVIDTVALEAMSPTDRDVVFEKWEGVLIKVQNVRAAGTPTNFGGASNPIDSFGVNISNSLVMDSNLAMFPSTVDGSTCFASVTGVEDYIAKNWTIYPRTTAEMVLGGTGCPASTNVTIADVQSGVATGQVTINDVFVVAVSSNRKNLWISQSLTAAQNEGVYVFANVALAADVMVGAKVNVIGTVTEFNDATPGATLTEIKTPTITVTAAPSGAPVPLGNQAITTMVDGATGEPFESILVTLTDVKVNVLGDPAAGGNFGVGQLQQGATTFLSDDDIFLLTDPVGTCYATITGIWTFQVFNDQFGLLPITATPGGTCP